jgi:hypothetical protein
MKCDSAPCTTRTNRVSISTCSVACSPLFLVCLHKLPRTGIFLKSRWARCSFSDRHSSMCSLACGSALCAGLSVVGIVFLTSIGALYTTQPFFTTPDLEDAAQAAVQCYIGAGLYAAALLLSLYGMWFDTRRKHRSARAALYDGESIAGQSHVTPCK